MGWEFFFPARTLIGKAVKAKAPFPLYLSVCVVLRPPNKPTNGLAPQNLITAPAVDDECCFGSHI